jgi:hypothetical protein
LYKSNPNNLPVATMPGGTNLQQASASGALFGYTSSGTLPAGGGGGGGGVTNPGTANNNNIVSAQNSKAQTLDQLASTSPSAGIFGLFSNPSDSTNNAPVSTSTITGPIPNSTQNLAVPGNTSVATSSQQQQQQQQQTDLFVPPQQKVESNFWISRQKEYLANQKQTAAKLAQQVDTNPEEEKVANSNFDKQVIGDLQTQHLHALPLLKKEEIAKRLSPFIIIPELNVRVEHARYITTLAAQDPRVLHGWQVNYKNRYIELLLKFKGTDYLKY